MRCANTNVVATFGANAMNSYSRKAEISRADYQSTNRKSGVSQQAGSHGITNLSDTFDETQNFIQGRTNLEILGRDAKFSPETPPLLPAAGTQLQAVATSGTHARQVGTANALEGLCSVRLKKRRREQTSNLSHVKHTESKPRFPLCLSILTIQGSDDGARGSKRTKVDCDCEDDHTWWMTIKIGEMNEVLQRIDTAIGVVKMLSNGSNDLGNIITEYNLIDLLKESRAILDDAKDDIKTKGGRDKEATK